MALLQTSVEAHHYVYMNTAITDVVTTVQCHVRKVGQKLMELNTITVSQKNCAFLFLSKLCQISMNFNKFW